MNSILSVTIIFCVLVTFSVAVSDEDRAQAPMECKTLENASEDDVQQYLNHKQLKGPNSKCFLACIFERNGAIRDKTIQPEQLKSMLTKEYAGNEQALKQISDMVNECRAINHMDRCELASQLKGCLDKAAVIRGFN